MGIWNWLFGKVEKLRVEDPPWAEETLRKLIAKDDETFSEGLEEIEGMADTSQALSTVRQAIRLRARRRKIRFYEPVTGFTHFGGEEIGNAQVTILQLAQAQALLFEPERSGRLISAFCMLNSFEDVVGLAHEVLESGGLKQSHAFQLLYNQNKLAVMLGSGRTNKTVLLDEPPKRNFAGKQKKCIHCGTELQADQLQCPACESYRFIWE